MKKLKNDFIKKTQFQCKMFKDKINSYFITKMVILLIKQSKKLTNQSLKKQIKKMNKNYKLIKYKIKKRIKHKKTNL